jgi:hypothetical protein
VFKGSDDDDFTDLEIRKNFGDVLADVGCFRKVFEEKRIVAERGCAFVIIFDEFGETVAHIDQEKESSHEVNTTQNGIAAADVVTNTRCKDKDARADDLFVKMRYDSSLIIEAKAEVGLCRYRKLHHTYACAH